MKNHFSKALVGMAVALAFSASANASITISNGQLSAVVNDSGTFSSLSYTGTEVVDWGTPLSYYWLNDSEAGSPFVANNVGSTNPLSAFTTGGGTVSFTGNSGGLTFNQTISLIHSKAVVSVTLSNDSGAAINGVQWGVGVDPDQGEPSTFDTNNSILGQGNASAAKAVAGGKAITLRNTTSSGAYDIRAYLDGTCCSAVNPGSILGGAAQSVGGYGIADRSINLAYNIGTIATDSSVTIGYEYVFAPVPEPETYAMLMAGLGLMGLIARRRKQQS